MKSGRAIIVGEQLSITGGELVRLRGDPKGADTDTPISAERSSANPLTRYVRNFSDFTNVDVGPFFPTVTAGLWVGVSDAPGDGLQLASDLITGTADPGTQILDADIVAGLIIGVSG